MNALRRGAIVVFRHAIAPGGGDPPGMVIGDCSTQRNLDAAGRQQAKDIGERLRADANKSCYTSPRKISEQQGRNDKQQATQSRDRHRSRQFAR